ncbi:MAG: 30S ribosome-binding factor RbfA [Candidatus Neomarinimicrobiota bacterium]|jgi:ribosome-binding factor A|nr:30S ribosome-binding factor RbfA [Candidatus Neomarinimicrobiota bacterium]MDD3966059.1 30S ribosome-binding factor RbfA [Candidatus Neomarinimicrobiota bacterium]MDX9781051.1 30S ribosome-binding factor RbfA [bacterium]
MRSRTERLSREIRRTVGDLLVHAAPRECSHVMLTVSQVEMTPDLKEARIYISVYPGDETVRGKCLKVLKEYKGRIRLEIGNKVKMRFVPEVKLFIDNSLDQVERVNTLLRDI